MWKRANKRGEESTLPGSHCHASIETEREEKVRVRASVEGREIVELWYGREGKGGGESDETGEEGNLTKHAKQYKAKTKETRETTRHSTNAAVVVAI